MNLITQKPRCRCIQYQEDQKRKDVDKGSKYFPCGCKSKDFCKKHCGCECCR